MSKVIGIDLGTTNSVVAVMEGGEPTVITNPEGSRLTPSVVAFSKTGEVLVGEVAKRQAITNPDRTFRSIKRHMGEHWKSDDIDGKKYTAQEISARTLMKLKRDAEAYLGDTVTQAVITVPAYFDDAQRTATQEAGTIAGLEVLRIINEPTASALAYGLDKTDGKDEKVAVYDLGGGTYDISILDLSEGVFQVLSTNGDTHLGGDDFDQVLIDYFAKEFVKKHKSAGDPRENERSMAKLKLECEAVKKALSIGQAAQFAVESLAGGVDFNATINRTRYDLLGNKLFGAFTRLVQHAVEKAELDPLDITEIVLAGGNSHTPKVASAVGAAFPESTTVLAPSTSSTAINPSELAVRGAAIQASLIQEFEAEDIEQSLHPMVTVTPHLSTAIGVLCISGDESNGVFHAIVDAETPLPVRRTATITTPREGGDVLIKLVEGARHIKVTKPEPKPKAEKDDEDSDSDDDSDDEDEELREKTWKIGSALAEAALRGVKKGAKVEVQINIATDLSVTALFREVGGQGGVRGQLQGKAAQNGSA